MKQMRIWMKRWVEEDLVGIQTASLNLLLKIVSPLFFILVCIISICKYWFDMSWGKCFSILGNRVIACLELAPSIMVRPDGWGEYVLATYLWFGAIVVVVFVFSLILSIIRGIFQLIEWYSSLRAKHLERRYERDMLKFRFLASRGDGEACYRIGEYYHKGKGVQKSYGDALRWYRKAAENGHVKAMEALAEYYEELYKKLGVAQSAEEAAKWRAKAKAK